METTPLWLVNGKHLSLVLAWQAQINPPNPTKLYSLEDDRDIRSLDPCCHLGGGWWTTVVMHMSTPSISHPCVCVCVGGVLSVSFCFFKINFQCYFFPSSSPDYTRYIVRWCVMCLGDVRCSRPKYIFSFHDYMLCILFHKFISLQGGPPRISWSSLSLQGGPPRISWSSLHHYRAGSLTYLEWCHTVQPVWPIWSHLLMELLLDPLDSTHPATHAQHASCHIYHAHQTCPDDLYRRTGQLSQQVTSDDHKLVIITLNLDQLVRLHSAAYLNMTMWESYRPRPISYTNFDLFK